MKKMPKCYGIIPTRYESSRFPGKSLAEILGKPMFWHVYDRACKCPLMEQVILATDDDRIFSAAKKMDVPVVMTSTSHLCGTDRVLEAARILKVPEDSVVVNIQGDEPALVPEMLSELVAPFESPDVQVTTLAHEITTEEAQNADNVKVVFSRNHQALYFSRFPIPYNRVGGTGEYYGHIGLYAFKMSTLERFVSLPAPSKLEYREKLEQLRLLENSIPIHIALTNHSSHGVDRPEDIEIVVEILKKYRVIK